MSDTDNPEGTLNEKRSSSLTSTALPDGPYVPLSERDETYVMSLSKVLRWSRQPLHELTVGRSGVEFDRSEIIVLDILWREGAMRIADIAEVVQLDHSTVSRRVTSIVAAGYACKRHDPQDRRATLIELTDKGQQLRDRVGRAWRSIFLDLVRTWDDADRDDFSRLLQKVISEF